MSFLGSLLKKVKKPLLGVLRAGASIATGGLSEKGIQLAQGIKKFVQVKKANKILDSSPQMQLAQTKYTVPPNTPVGVTATTMPGGAKLVKTQKRAASTRKKAKPKSAPKAKKKGGRKPPSGGLDLKALAASWRAAGKPGTWQDWIKQNK